MKPQQTDAFDGIYDNEQTGQRELWRDGQLRTYFAKGLDPPLAGKFGMRGPWGTFPNHPNAGGQAGNT